MNKCLNEAFYGFDAVHITSKTEPYKIKRLADATEWHKHCKSYDIEPSKGFYQQHKSIIFVVAPTVRFFNLLATQERQRRIKDCAISYIEIAKDIPCANFQEAIQKVKEICRIICLRYARCNDIYDQNELMLSQDSHEGRQLGPTTGYLGKNFKFVIYAAEPSKFFDAPCVHMEFRIAGGAKTVFKRTKCADYPDGIKRFNIEKWFEDSFSKYVVCEDFEQEVLGRYLDGIPKRKNLNNRERLSVLCTAMCFCKINGARFEFYPPLFKKESFKPSFLEKVKTSADPVSVYLRKKLNIPECEYQIDDNFAEKMNEVVFQGSKPASAIFYKIPMLPETRRLAEKKYRSEREEQLYRRLMFEAAYPDEIVRCIKLIDTVKTTAELRNAWKNESALIRKKRGPKSDYDMRILAPNALSFLINNY